MPQSAGKYVTPLGMNGGSFGKQRHVGWQGPLKNARTDMRIPAHCMDYRISRHLVAADLEGGQGQRSLCEQGVRDLSDAI